MKPATLFLLPWAATALPAWSWDTIANYVHARGRAAVVFPRRAPRGRARRRAPQCANTTGEWNADALAVMATKPFVVFEKNHKIAVDPVVDGAEDKISASCDALKALNADVDCYMRRIRAGGLPRRASRAATLF